MGDRWQNERKNEHYYKKAKREGYRSRATYKLLQLDEKFEILEPGDIVLDLGAAPGGWLQLAREKVGEDGFVLGVDLDPIDDLDYQNVKSIVADVTEMETEEIIQKNLPDSPDVVLSDAAPDISGIWDVDHARSVGLARSALNISRRLLKPGGNVLIKIFQGEFFNDFMNDFKNSFDFYKSSKPEASRKESAETYVIAKGFRPS